MANAARQSTVDTTTMEGLDELLESQNDVQGRVDSEDWTVEEAADYLGLSVKTIRRRLKERKLDGYKIDGPNGPEWRIKLHTLTNDHGRGAIVNPTATTVQGADPMMGDSTLVKELIEKLEVLTYRNGYLEAQLLERESQLKLLSDTSKKGGWNRFWQWFTR
jgi:excisionase family DNA binding protein